MPESSRIRSWSHEVSRARLAFSHQLKPPPFFLPNDDSMFLSDQAIYDYGAWTMYWWRGWLKK